MKQKPSFQFYPQDFLGSMDVQTMTAEQIGCYCLLLFNCYNNGGDLPSDEEELKMLCRGMSPAIKVLKKFYKNGEFFRHKRIDAELKKQAKFNSQQKKRAEKRWSKPSNSGTDGTAMASPAASLRQCSSSSTSSSIKKEIEKEKKSDPLFNSFTEYCHQRQLVPGITPARYFEMRTEYEQKLSWWTEVRACIDWCYDNGKKVLSAPRLRNWMRNAVKFQREKQIKQQAQEFSEKYNYFLVGDDDLGEKATVSSTTMPPYFEDGEPCGYCEREIGTRHKSWCRQ